MRTSTPVEAVAAALFAGIVLAAGLLSRPRRKTQLETWSELAQARGFRMVPDVASAIGVRLEATVENFLVQVATDKDSGPEVTLFSAARGSIPVALTITPFGWGNSLWQPDARRLLTGDAQFDGQTIIQADTPTIRALLDADTRRALLAAQSGVEVTRGTVTVQVPGVVSLRQEIDEALERVLALARRLSIADHDVPARLAAIATSDPNRACRLHSYRALLASFGREPITAEVTRAALGSGFAPAMRLLAAEQLDDRAVMQSLMMGPDLEVAVAACEAVMARGDGQAEARLIALLEDPSTDVRRRAAEVLGRHGTVAAVEALLQCAERGWVVGSGEAQDAARAAVTQIQSRLQGAEGGRLSLVEVTADDGALSVVDRAGALTMADAAGALPVAGTDDPER